jgi:hypothetical protein
MIHAAGPIVGWVSPVIELWSNLGVAFTHEPGPMGTAPFTGSERVCRLKTSWQSDRIQPHERNPMVRPHGACVRAFGNHLVFERFS